MLSQLANVYRVQADLAATLAAGQQALVLAAAIGDVALQVDACYRLGLVSYYLGDYRGAVRLSRRNMEALEAGVGHPSEAYAGIRERAWLARLLSHLGQFVEGRRHGEEALRLGEQVNYSRNLAWLSAACLLAGHVIEAYRHAREALAVARQHSTRGYEVLALCQLGEVHAQADLSDTKPAEAQYRQALALAEELSRRPLVVHYHRGLGTLYTKIGRPEEACAELTAAIDLYREMEMRFWLPQAEASLAQTQEGFGGKC